MKEPKAPKLEFEDYFLVSQEDIYKIDCLIGALNLAVTEILERRPVKEKRWAPMPAQNDYDDQISKIIYGTQPNLFG
jgi:hypothetical protein